MIKTIEQSAQGLCTRRKSVKYKANNVRWFCNMIGEIGLGMNRRGSSHCIQYMISESKLWLNYSCTVCRLMNVFLKTI